MERRRAAVSPATAVAVEKEVEKLKLRDKVAILLGVPLVLQLTFGAILIDNLLRVDTAAKREAVSKQIIAACQDVRIELVRYLSYFRARQFFEPKTAEKYRTLVERVVTEKLDVLDTLLKDDPEGRAIVGRYRQKLHRFEELMTDAGGSIESGLPEISMTRFVRESEFFEEVVGTFNGIVKEEELLVLHYRPVEQTLKPESSKARETLLYMIILAAVCNAITVLILALAIGQKTLRRLAVLMSNIARFSEGETKLVEIDGKDEIAEIDLKFREMADAKTKAEELRRSLVAMVSHDIRSPLTSVGMNLSMIMEMHEESLDPGVIAKIRKTDGEIQRLIRLADGLLEIEKIEFGNVDLDCRWTDPAELVEISLHAVNGIADSKKIEVEVIQDKDIDVFCDADRITQVLVNLMSNAIKFSPANSKLTIIVKQTGDETKFEIIDQGTGVSPEDQPKLFQKFTQLDQVKQLRKLGSGLGLYISRMLVEAHGGTIGYSGTEGGGSCFWFVLKSPDLDDPDEHFGRVDVEGDGA